MELTLSGDSLSKLRDEQSKHITWIQPTSLHELYRVQIFEVLKKKGLGVQLYPASLLTASKQILFFLSSCSSVETREDCELWMNWI